MRRALGVLLRGTFPLFVGRLMGFLGFCPSAQTVWLTRWRPTHGMKVTAKTQRRRDLRRAEARQDRARGRRKEEMGPSPEPR